MPAASSNLKGAAAMVAATGFFVVCDCFMKVVMAEIPPFEVLFLRGIAATICCSVLVVAFGQGKAVVAVRQPAVILRGVFEMLSVCCYIVALANMPIADVIAIGQTAPLMLILAAALISKERIGVGRLVLIAVGFLGAVLVAQPGTGGVSLYAILAFATALGIAARDLVGRRVGASVPGFVVILATSVIVMVAAAAMTTLTERWVAPSGRDVLFLFAAGLLVSLGHLAIFLAYRFGTAGAVAPFFYSFAVWAVAAGFVVWREIPNTLALLGIGLIMASGLAIVLIDRRRIVEPRGEIDL
jgi:drug/metabolite transporter (DMT)-like permease